MEAALFSWMESRVLARLRRWATALKQNLHALYLACQHPETPWYARLMALIVVGYAFSPIDLIPDFVPLLGYLDDLILLPLGIYLAVRLIPASVWTESRARARAEAGAEHPVSWVAALVIILLWLLLLALAIKFVVQFTGTQ